MSGKSFSLCDITVAGWQKGKGIALPVNATSSFFFPYRLERSDN